MSNLEVQKVKTPMPKASINSDIISEISKSTAYFNTESQELTDKMLDLLQGDTISVDELKALRLDIINCIGNFVGDLNCILEQNPNQDVGGQDIDIT